MNYWEISDMTVWRDLEEHEIVPRVTIVTFKLLSRACRGRSID